MKFNLNFNNIYANCNRKNIKKNVSNFSKINSKFSPLFEIWKFRKKYTMRKIQSIFFLLFSVFKTSLTIYIKFPRDFMGDSPKRVNFQVEKNYFLKVFFRFFLLEMYCWGVPEAKSAIPPNSYSKWRNAERFEISMTRSMEFHRSGTGKISQIDRIPSVCYLKS